VNFTRGEIKNLNEMEVPSVERNGTNFFLEKIYSSRNVLRLENIVIGKFSSFSSHQVHFGLKTLQGRAGLCKTVNFLGNSEIFILVK
jgi:hypothetical protein